MTLVREVAGKSPFAGQSCNVSTVWGTSPGDKEADPYIAVNPTDPENLVAAWIDSTRATIDTGYSTDGGRSWHVVILRGIDSCTGAPPPLGASSDPTDQWEASDGDWISFGPDGVAYLSVLTWANFVTPPLADYVSVVHIATGD